MNYIIEILNDNFVSKIKTTKKLIYKYKEIDQHNIKESYEKLVKTDKYLKSTVKYGKQSLYYNDSIFGSIKQLNLIASKLSNEHIFSKEFDYKVEGEEFIVSEIQNSLWIEGVRSSKKRIKEIIKTSKSSKLENTKDIYIKNFHAAFEFISTTEKINESNLLGLYLILSKDIDLKEEKLTSFPYRDGDVIIGENKYQGIAPSKIKESMDSIFEFIENYSSNNSKESISNIILVHYLFEIIHPYYDMNGRMGRLLALWFARKNTLMSHFLYFSKAINFQKNEFYYNAFKKSIEKDFKFDATYFLGSIFAIMISYKISYKLMKYIENNVKNKYKVKLSKLSKEIIISLLSKEKDKFYKAKEIILGHSEINPGQISTSFSELERFKIIESINSNPKEYKILWTDNIIKIINRSIFINNS